MRGSRIIREQYFESICQKAKLSGYYICATRSCSVVTRAPLSEIFRRRSPGRREDEHRAAGVVGFLLGPSRWEHGNWSVGRMCTGRGGMDGTGLGEGERESERVSGDEGEGGMSGEDEWAVKRGKKKEGIRAKRVRRPAFHGARINYTRPRWCYASASERTLYYFSFSIRPAISVFVVLFSRSQSERGGSSRTGLLHG